MYPSNAWNKNYYNFQIYTSIIRIRHIIETDEPKDKFIVWLEREFWEDMARTVFREPHNAYRTQLKYLTGDIQKPFKESFSSYKARVEQVFNYLEDFPVPCLMG